MVSKKRQMQAARYHGPGKGLQLEQVDVPRVGEMEALVAIKAAGVCHTELHILSGVLNLGIAPITLGHEIAGEVVEVGAGVSDSKVGDRVIVHYYATCGRCHWCRTDRANLCPNIVAEYGFTADGGYAQYICVPGNNLVPLPPNLGYEEGAALCCSVTTAIHSAMTIAKVKLGETAVAYGVGAVGFALIQVCKLSGARVIAVGRSEQKLKVAREVGADETINSAKADVTSEIRRITGGEGADVIFELVGIKETMQASLNSLRKRGCLVFIGYSEDQLVTSPLNLVINEAVITASVGNTLEELHLAVQLAAQGKVRPRVDRTLPLASVNDALEALRRGEVIGRAILIP